MIGGLLTLMVLCLVKLFDEYVVMNPSVVNNKTYEGYVMVYEGVRMDGIWFHMLKIVLNLTANMRLNVGARPKDVTEIQEFAYWILEVGDYELEEANDREVSIDILTKILIHEVDDPVTYIIDFTYPNILDNISDTGYFQENAILAPTNEVVDNINKKLLEKFQREEMVYLSCDSVDKVNEVPIMLLRNIDQTNGLGALRFFIKRSFKRMDNFEMLDFRKAEEENEANKRVLELAKDDKKKLTFMPSLNLFKDHSYDSSNYINVENFEALDYEDAHHGMPFQKTPKLVEIKPCQRAKVDINDAIDNIEEIRVGDASPVVEKDQMKGIDMEKEGGVFGNTNYDVHTENNSNVSDFVE
nr:hypothetical protein [Tanacetum cinerariifolium]